jgi:hypothetical protein
LASIDVLGISDGVERASEHLAYQMGGTLGIIDVLGISEGWNWASKMYLADGELGITMCL